MPPSDLYRALLTIVAACDRALEKDDDDHDLPPTHPLVRPLVAPEHLRHDATPSDAAAHARTEFRLVR